MGKIKIGINGFGRIGRQAFKVALEHEEVEVVGINDLTTTSVLAHLLKYDSVYGRYHRKVEFDETNIIVDGKKYPVGQPTIAVCRLPPIRKCVVGSDTLIPVQPTSRGSSNCGARLI